VDKQHVQYKDLGIIDYKSAWDYQEELVKANVSIKTEARKQVQPTAVINTQLSTINYQLSTINY
jgi:lipoyl(octanoyl) transferase